MKLNGKSRMKDAEGNEVDQVQGGGACPTISRGVDMRNKILALTVVLAIGGYLVVSVLTKSRTKSVTSPQRGDVITNTIGMKLVWIPAGEFEMGYFDNTPEEKPVHSVKITDGFRMGQTEVTQGQYKTVMNSQPWSGKIFTQESASNPGNYVSWNDAVEFCKKLSQKEGVTYRLPTEAEWEYACRAGTQTEYSFGDSKSLLGEYAWFTGNAYKIDEKYAHPVGQKKPNPWGLYDMHGNVSEWCSDRYDADYYSKSPTADPQGSTTGGSRVLRGGSWSSTPWGCRSAFRGDGISPVVRDGVAGFRIVLDLN